MESPESYALRICGPKILQNLYVSDVLDQLIADGWLTESECELINAEKTSTDKCRKLLDYLRRMPPEGIRCFLNALEESKPWLAEYIRLQQKDQSSHSKRHERTVSNLREALINGAVPDNPTRFVHRPTLTESLSGCLRDLASRFRVQSSPPKCATNICDIMASTNLEEPSLTSVRNHPPPTNAWLLVHGPPGCGKTVLCTSTLRDHASAVIQYFPGGVVWMRVGPLMESVPDSNPSEAPVQSANAKKRQLISFVDRLERRLAHLTRRTTADYNSVDGSMHIMRNSSPPVSNLDESSERLRRTLIRRQERPSWGPAENDSLSTSLLLIVLDDVWDVEVGQVLSSMPAAFMVTSRDQSVLSRVAGKVDQFNLHEDLTDVEAAQLLSAWSNLPTTNLLSEKPQSEVDSHLHHLVPLCRGSPLAVNVVGNLLLTQPHRVSDYLCNPKGAEPEFIDWVALSWPSSYGYDSVFLTLNYTLTRLPGDAQTFFEQLVIFDADVTLNHKMLAILWNVSFDVAEALLNLFVRFSVAVKCWSSYTGGYGFHLYPLQLDVLRSSIDPIKQTQYHAKFIENYSLFCAGRWWQLTSSGEHTYFWHHATDHLFQGRKFNHLADLLTNLEFLRGRLAVIGASLVIADFRRYQAVFATLHRIDEWHAYVRFVQTNAYFLIDPGTLQPTDRSRSPYRKRLRAGSFWSFDSSSGVATAVPQPTSPWQTDSPGSKPVGPRPIAGTQANRPKGIDLIQLGLGLPHDSPVFRQSVELLLKQHQIQSISDGKSKPSPTTNTLSEYYWFWCNSHVAASQLVWAIPTGPQAVTCLAVEAENCPELRSAPDPLQTTSPNAKLAPGRFRKRYLAGTCDGRVLLLDANSGYEVAVQQIYPEKMDIKLLTFVSNNTECLTCGSDGTLVVSTLPVAEPLEPLPSAHEIEINIEIGSGSSDRGRSPTNYQYDHMGGLDVDDEYDAALSIPQSGTMGRRGSLLLSDDTDEELNDTLVDDLNLSVSAWRRRSSAASPAINPPGLTVPAPIVLAELPRLSELARVDRSGNVPNSRASRPDDNAATFELHSISVSPKLDIVLLSGEGDLNADILHTDGPGESEPVQPSFLLPSVYYLKRNGNQFYLDQSRSLRLPSFSPWFESVVGTSQLSVVLTNISAVSDDSQYLAIGLSNGLIWLYSLDEVSWISCIPTYVANMWNKLMEDSSGECENHTEKLIRERVLTGLEIGTVPSACLFLPTFNTDEDEVVDNGQINHMFAAAIGSSVLVWSVPQAVPFDESKLTEQDQIVSHSRPALCLRCALTCSVLTLDACLIADQRVLAGGTTNGRVLFWRIRDGCLLLDLSAHSSWVTAVRLLPPDINSSDDDYVNVNSLPVGLLTASSDGVIKRWEVGAACLPSPSTPIPAGMTSFTDLQQLRRISLQSMLSTRSNDRPNAVHGLWTDVFDVWFGPHASLLVVGRRRHSSDLQFLFRPQENACDGLARHDTAFTFQEIAIKPSQPIYWRQSDCPTVVLSPRKISEQSQGSSSKKVTPTSPGPPPVSRKISRHTMPPTRHWIATTGLSGTIHGRATAVSFWSSGHWVAVGFSIGIVQVFSLHFNESTLFGVVKRFCLITELAGIVPTQKPSHSKVLDRVVHLHTWQSTDAADEKSTLVVLAVFASGTVRYWHMASVSHDVSASCHQELQPTETWVPMHDVGTMHQSRQQRASRKTSTSELQSKLLCDNDELDSIVPVTWSTLRSIPTQSYPPPCNSHVVPDSTTRVNGTGDMKPQTILVWLTAGYDGMVYGRQLVFPNAKLSPMPEDQTVPDPISPHRSPKNLGSAQWRLDLAAHAPAPIADADVDPTGQWLLTGSTDETAKVWCLSSGTLVFDTGTHGACVRSVCFRPVLDEPLTTSGHEWFVATGDDTGALRIWVLPSRRLRKAKTASTQLGQLNRSLSPDQLLYRKPNNGTRSDWHSSSSRHLNRLPSPDMKELDRSGARDARAAFFSNAAGFGGSWLRRLVWSPDGRLITGLSDRLCVWPFEAPNPRLVPSVPVRDRLAGDFQGPRLELKRCRVLRVLSSGLAERSTSALHMLSVGPRRRCCRSTASEHAANPILTELPPTIVTVDVNTGTLYVFDPIGALFQSELQD